MIDLQPAIALLCRELAECRSGVAFHVTTQTVSKLTNALRKYRLKILVHVDANQALLALAADAFEIRVAMWSCSIMFLATQQRFVNIHI